MAHDARLGNLGGLLALALTPAFWPTAATAHTCAAPFTTPLLAGPGNDIGVVEVCNDDTTLTVTYEADTPWCLTKTALDVADSVAGIPQNPHGKPITGRFAYKSNHRPCAQSFGVTSALGDWGPGSDLVVAAHATASEDEGRGPKSDAWGSGPAFPGDDGATYFTYTVQEAACGGANSCTVFITSTTHNGNLGGLTGADAICNQLASNAGLPGAGNYLAWLTIYPPEQSPSTRFTHASVPYKRVDGVQVASNWSDLTDGSITQPINVDENGNPINLSSVWTSTASNGTVLPDPAECGTEWMSAINGLVGAVGLAGAGRTDATWTAFGYATCDTQVRLYCFQQ